MGFKHFLHRPAARHIRLADNTGGNCRGTGNGGNGFRRRSDILRFTHRAKMLRTRLAVIGQGFKIHRGHNIVACTQICQQLRCLIVGARNGPQVVMRIDNGQLRIQRFFLMSVEPGLVNKIDPEAVGKLRCLFCHQC